MSSDKLDQRRRVPGYVGKKRCFGRKRKRERKFQGTTDQNEPAPKRQRSSSSARKLPFHEDSDTSDTKNRIIDVSILFTELQNILCCVKCHGRVSITETGLRGLGFKIQASCTKCHQVTIINSSKCVGEQKNAFEVNRRSVLASRALGHGHAGLSTLCGIMDLPPPVAHSFYNTINEKLCSEAEKVAQTSMDKAVKKEVEATPPANPGLDVSGDGTWRRKGFASLQGVASLVGNRTGQVIDVAIKNSFCNACKKWEGKEDSEQYKVWFEEHESTCSSNHSGSAGKMEVDGVLQMFEQSVHKYGVKYQNYIGDGDSKVFCAITEAQPYGCDFPIEKKECIGHVQKRMGTRLRNLKKLSGKQPLSDGKSIGGRGRLTAQTMNQMTEYYGNAIRANSDSVKKMSDAVWATFFHKSSTDEEPQHHFCPPGKNSWCKWQKAKALDRLDTYKHPSAIPPAVMEKVRPIYEDLTAPDLLSRCLGGYTQNNNESFNNCIWKLVTKTSFSGVTVLKLGVFIAVTCFNDGRSGFLNIMKNCDIAPGQSALQWVKSSDDTRLFHAERKLQESSLESRKKRRRVRIQEESYGAGDF